MIRQVSVVSTLDTNIVSTGEVVIGATKMTDLAPSSGKAANLNHIVLSEEGGQRPGLMFVFFSAAPDGTFTVNADPVFSDADLEAITGIIEIDSDDWATMGARSLLDKFCWNEVLKADASGDMWLVVLARSQYDAVAADDLNIKLFFEVGK